MDRLSQLPEELLLKILSQLPSTKDVVATMVLSKRWLPLWKLVPKLVYDDHRYQSIEYGRFSRFVDRSLLLHKAPILDSLHFRVGHTSGVADLPLWTTAADKHSVRELVIEISSSSTASPAIVPRSLYSMCRMLVTLKLQSATLADAASLPSFPSLKKLSLVSVKYPGGDEFVSKLLSTCPVLEDLAVEQCADDNVTIFTVKVPSLKCASLRKPFARRSVDEGIVIDAPSLEYLEVVDSSGGFFVIENDMPCITKADVVLTHPAEILSCITSAKFLNLCLPYSKDAYPAGGVFRRLVDLEICTCETEWLDLLMRVLSDSPNLQSLKVKQWHCLRDEKLRPCWNEPSSVPECLSSSLETLEWGKFEGTKEEEELVKFILRNGSCLKKVTISSKLSDSDKKLEMLKKLSLSFRRSPIFGQTCGAVDIPVWTRAADRLSVRELIISMGFSVSPVILPRSLYTMCKTLVTLKLKYVGLPVFSSPVSFPSLKTLNLVSVKYPGDDFVKRFLFGCPVLETLFVVQYPGDNVTVFAVRVPSLKTLMMFKSLDGTDRNANDADGFAIDAPSLEVLYICGRFGGFGVIENEMPNLVMADIDARCGCYSKVMGSITPAKRLHLRFLYPKDVHPVGNVFHRLKHLKMSRCGTECFNTLMCLLRDSPKLKSLELKKCHPLPNEPRRFWTEPSSVPECLLSSLETLKWVKYEGTEEEKEVAAFILRNGSCLKNVTISSTSTDRDKKLEMIKELSVSLLGFESFGIRKGISLMDLISEFNEALLLRILSQLPTTKDVVRTMVLSRRWHSLWKVPKLVYDDEGTEYGKFSRFVDRSLILHKAPVETLHFKLVQNSGVAEIGIWITIAAKCSVRDLSIDIDCSSSTTPVKIPWSFYYRAFQMLVALKLASVVLASSSLPSFTSLKKLGLVSVKYTGADEFVKRLLSSCPVLEDLAVEQCKDDNVSVFSVNVPSLKSASFSKSSSRYGDEGIVIDAPSLEYLEVVDSSGGFFVIENDMPCIVKADVVVTHPGEILSSITSVKRLILCLPYSKDAYPAGSVFRSLVDLEICTCETEWLNLLMRMLNDSPNLQSLRLDQWHCLRNEETRSCWNEPSSVPDCLSSSLETLKWVNFEGTKEEKEVVKFILRSGSCLKKVTIFSKTSDTHKKLEMIKELTLSTRRSPNCQLVFS
ncbi:unnamed protein product [Thlaspi arvense]|uniref:F-box domain-containing protein n=1 Tax=Thlaspi arvense TaxID=13288 RepID=A0AAU9SMT9_THLAR|nr:unnamed protein product [Thlaspi arvense]